MKSAYPIDNETLKKITKTFKKKIITEMSYAQSLLPKKEMVASEDDLEVESQESYSENE